ncbi:RteC domain-containing protein [Flavobacterium sp. FlaQc-28]|uniref:RteC domain-containing protein n=1 Tax=Flavobacterium sp. FlaQc-28 TaxID=3374178 RepID=UPI003757D663
MTGYYKKEIDDLDSKINELTIDQDNSFASCEKVIELVLNKVLKLKKYVLMKGFKSQQEEVHFFKHIKPRFIAKLIYYNSIYKIEIKRPYGGEKTIKKYLTFELSKIKRYFDSNLEFYKYYRTNSTYLDHKYFVRGKHDIKLNLDTFYFEADHNFVTSHDYKVAKIIANDLIQVYLEGQLYNNQKKAPDKSELNWTGSKTSLIELIYALHLQGVFDNGNADIKVIAKIFESMFNIDLGDFYHTYLELRGRKINRTKFLDNLRDILIKKMDDQDEK